MTRGRRLALAFVMGLSTVVGAASASAGEGRHERMIEMMRGARMGRPSDMLGRERPLLSLALRNRGALGLSADQVRTLEGLIDRFRKDADQRVSQIEAGERELASLLDADPADMAKVEAKVREIETQRADLRIARIRTIQEGRTALTPEQRKKLGELVSAEGPRAQHRRRMMEMMGSMMGGDGSMMGGGRMMGGQPRHRTPPGGEI
jgi:Spy/CpxP family protein refolding chaperone